MPISAMQQSHCELGVKLKLVFTINSQQTKQWQPGNTSNFSLLICSRFFVMVMKRNFKPH
ncbi:UNVERIFIED_CONTAM: hypothetical protein LBW93_05585 [Wolbachia endosymbiont of Nasonia longicornis]